MPKVKTKDLKGAALNSAVAKCNGWTTMRCGYDCNCLQHRDPLGRPQVLPSYSTEWSLAGPIIEAEMIDLVYRPGDKKPGFWDSYGPRTPHGFSADTPLVAAMRCFVASKLGDEIDIPEELL